MASRLLVWSMLPFIYSRTSRPEIDIAPQISSWFRKHLMISPLDSDSYENVMPRAMARGEKRDEHEHDHFHAQPPLNTANLLVGW